MTQMYGAQQPSVLGLEGKNNTLNAAMSPDTYKYVQGKDWHFIDFTNVSLGSAIQNNSEWTESANYGTETEPESRTMQAQIHFPVSMAQTSRATSSDFPLGTSDFYSVTESAVNPGVERKKRHLVPKLRHCLLK